MAKELQLAYDTGATITAQVYAADGSLAGTVSLTESPTGYYTADFPPLIVGVYNVVYFAGSTRIGCELPAVNWSGTAVINDSATIADIDAKVTAIGTPVVTIQSPLAADGTITLIKGDDYKATDARAITANFTNAPSLSDATIAIIANPNFDGSNLTIPGTILTSTSASFDIARVVTSNLTIGTEAYEYQMVATLSNGDVVTLQRGTIDVEALP